MKDALTQGFSLRVKQLGSAKMPFLTIFHQQLWSSIFLNLDSIQVKKVPFEITSGLVFEIHKSAIIQ